MSPITHSYVSTAPPVSGKVDSTEWNAAHVGGLDGLTLNVTAGKTLTLSATNDFTLTVPASLTAAGLAIANVFTESQTIPATSAAATKGLIVADGANKIVNFQGLDAGGNTYSFYGTNRTYGVGGWSATGWYAARKAGIFYVLNDAFYYYRFPASSNTPAAIFSILTAGADPNIRTTAQVENASNGLGAGADVFVKNDASVIGGMSMLSSGFSNDLYRSRLVFTSQRGISYVSDNTVASGGTYTIDFATGGYSNSVSATINADGSLTLSGRDATAVQLTTIGISTTNNAIKEVSRIRADVSTAATGGAAGFGPAQTFYAETATDGTIQQQAQISSLWTDATNATRKAKLQLSAYDTAQRIGIEVLANGSTPDINLLGDTWFIGSGYGLPYGSCYGNEIGWSQAAAQNTWYEISDADMADGELNLVTHDGSGKLTVSIAGRYLIEYSMTLEANAPNKHIVAAISVSGTENSAGQSHIETNVANEEMVLSGTAIISLSANATVEISVETTDTGAPTLSVQHLNITVVQVGG